MGKNTGIEWTDHSWPVVNGCRRISPGCGGPKGQGGCYAERLVSTRLRKQPKYEGLAEFMEGGPRWTGESRLWVPDLWLPLRTRKPAKWFVANMGDLFFEEVSNEEIAAVFGVMAACPQHTFQVLTKRPKRMREWFEWAQVWGIALTEGVAQMCIEEAYALEHGSNRMLVAKDPGVWPLPNVWLGVSVEDQQRACERIPELLKTPAALRFLSVEPLLEAVDLRAFLHRSDCLVCPSCLFATNRKDLFATCPNDGTALGPDIAIDWVILGGESGPRSREHNISWPRSIIAQCRAAGVAVFNKQLGANAIEEFSGEDSWNLKLADKKGGDMSEWPEDLRVREFPRG